MSQDDPIRNFLKTTLLVRVERDLEEELKQRIAERDPLGAMWNSPQMDLCRENIQRHIEQTAFDILSKVDPNVKG